MFAKNVEDNLSKICLRLNFTINEALWANFLHLTVKGGDKVVGTVKICNYGGKRYTSKDVCQKCKR